MSDANGDLLFLCGFVGMIVCSKSVEGENFDAGTWNCNTSLQGDASQDSFGNRDGVR